MLTPYFELSQTNDKLCVVVHAPYSNIAESEVYVDEDDFRFYSSPYYLRLHLPGHVKNCDNPSVQYNADNGQFSIELVKSTPGEEFKDLDLIAKFLSPQNRRIQVKPEIQVLSSSTNDDHDSNDEDDDDEPYDSSDEWFIDQEEPCPLISNVDLEKSKYGFGNTMSNVFSIVKDEFKDIFDIIKVEETLDADKKQLRETAELEKFCDDHYLYDLMEPSSDLTAALQYNPEYKGDVTFTTNESEKLKELGNKEHLLSKEQRRIAYFSLIDILYCYAYDHRTTLGESTVESAWTINKLSATLSWLQNYRSIKEVLICCIRRALCYPLFRHWDLSMQVLDDTACILNGGVRQVIRCLLRIHETFNKSEPRYILNQLYITDYCIWLQNDKNVDEILCKMSKMILEIKDQLQKSDVDLDIDILEIAAQSTLEENLAQNLCNLNIDSENSSATDTSSEADSEDSEESSDSSSGEELDSDDDNAPPEKNNT